MSTLQDINPDCPNETGCDPVENLIIPRTGDIGNFEVHRALPSRERRMVGPFIFWDQMGPGEFLTDQGVDVRPHPHIGLSTVTYLFDGTMDHKDSLGYEQRIKLGDVNLMTAGKGITHSERTGKDIRAAGPHGLYGIQSWLALPKEMEEHDPAFAHTDQSALPFIEEDTLSIRLIMGEAYGLKSPVTQHANTLYADAQLKAGAMLELPKHTEERAIYPLGGAVEVAGVRYEPMQLLVFRPGDDIAIKALEDTRLMVLGGATLPEKRYIFWNFVSSSKERIEQAKEDWSQGRFEMVGGDPEFIPLPEN